VAPAHLIYESDEAEADRFLVKKEVSFCGLSRPSALDTFLRGLPHGKAYKQVTDALLADDEIIEVKVEGWKSVYYALDNEAKLRRYLSGGRVPKARNPL